MGCAYSPGRSRTFPPAPLDQAWAVSGACCVPWSRGAAPCSPRSPCFLSEQLFTPTPVALLFSHFCQKRVRMGGISTVWEMCVGGGNPPLSFGGGFFSPLHLQIYSLVTSLRAREGGGVIMRWVRAASRPPMRHFQGRTEDGTRLDPDRTPLFPSLLSVSCTISAPLPVGRNDAVHDSRLLQSAATVWEFSSLIPPLLLTS